MRRHGFQPECRRVETAVAMRDALADGEWDVIISDYLMPEFNAFGAIQVCREAGLDIPFLVVSGSIGEDVAVEAMKSGVDDYLMKDNLSRLPVAIEREIVQARIRRERRALADAMSRDVAELMNQIRSASAHSLLLAEGNPVLKSNLEYIQQAAERALSTIERLQEKRKGRGTE